MKLVNTSVYKFPNLGIPHESNLNIIGVLLTSRKISHNLNISIDVDTNTYVQGIAGTNNQPKLMDAALALWGHADILGLKYPKVEAKVNILTHNYEILFLCYEND